MKVSLSPEADQDVDNIYLWIAAENMPAADQMMSDIIDFCFVSVADNPNIGRSYGRSMRQALKRGYRIIYKITETEIQIVRILHPARDHQNIVSEE